MSELVKNKEIQESLQKAMQHIYFDVHAIYEPDGSEIYGDCYLAAVDLFKQGMTFRVYFKINESGAFQAEYVERWHFG